MTVNERQKPLAPLPAGCVEGRFIQRCKRFSVEVEIAGKRVWAHTNNTGGMLGLLRPYARVLLSPALNPQRKLAWTLERIWTESGHGQACWVGVNTAMPNIVFKRAFMAGQLDFAREYENICMEAKIGGSRLDACLTGKNVAPLWVECKNTSLVEDGIAAFPDAESQRARKHLTELMERIRQGHQAAMFFLIQRADCCAFEAADYIDAAYAKLFHQALALGVQMRAFCADLRNDGLYLGRRLPIVENNV